MLQESLKITIKQISYLNFLFAKGNTVDDKQSCCFVRFWVSCIFGFQYALVFWAGDSILALTNPIQLINDLPCTSTLLTGERWIVDRRG